MQCGNVEPQKAFTLTNNEDNLVEHLQLYVAFIKKHLKTCNILYYLFYTGQEPVP